MVFIPNNVGYSQGAIKDAFQEENWDEFGIDGDNLTSCISFKDNFAMNS